MHSSTNPIRVGFVMHKMQVAGAEVLVKQIIERLDGQIDATVLCLDGIGALGRQLLDSGTPVHCLDRKPGIDFSVAKRIAKLANEYKLDVIHAHQYSPFFYSATAKLRHRLKYKIVLTEHGRGYPDSVSWKRKLANRLVLQRYADVTTGCCEFSTLALRSVDGFENAITLRNGVDIDGLTPRGTDAETFELRKRLGLCTQSLLVACVARFHPIKDHATLLRAWSYVRKDIPSAKLLLVGDGENRALIKRQIETEHLSDHVVLLGVRSDVPEILRAVDISAMTSLSEAASLTLLEAMACKCPSVVTDVGGNAEHVRDGIDGFLVPRGDAELVARRIAFLLAA